MATAFTSFTATGVKSGSRPTDAPNRTENEAQIVLSL